MKAKGWENIWWERLKTKIKIIWANKKFGKTRGGDFVFQSKDVKIILQIELRCSVMSSQILLNQTENGGHGHVPVTNTECCQEPAMKIFPSAFRGHFTGSDRRNTQWCDTFICFPFTLVLLLPKFQSAPNKKHKVFLPSLKCGSDVSSDDSCPGIDLLLADFFSSVHKVKSVQ